MILEIHGGQLQVRRIQFMAPPDPFDDSVFGHPIHLTGQGVRVGREPRQHGLPTPDHFVGDRTANHGVPPVIYVLAGRS